MDSGPVVFPASGFPRKNLGVDLCDYLHYIWSLFDSIFTAQRGKRIGTCELYSAELILLLVPSFPNKVVLELSVV